MPQKVVDLAEEWLLDALQGMWMLMLLLEIPADDCMKIHELHCITFIIYINKLPLHKIFKFPFKMNVNSNV